MKWTSRTRHDMFTTTTSQTALIRVANIELPCQLSLNAIIWVNHRIIARLRTYNHLLKCWIGSITYCRLLAPTFYCQVTAQRSTCSVIAVLSSASSTLVHQSTGNSIEKNSWNEKSWSVVDHRQLTTIGSQIRDFQCQSEILLFKMQNNRAAA